MPTRLGDVLESAREQCFVGRRAELDAFSDAIAGRSERRVVILHGPGGIGKTTLVQEMRRRARAAGRTVLLLDGREIDPSPGGFRAAAGPRPPSVLLIDAYEQLGAIDAWLRREFVPGRDAGDVLVLAGRDAPADAWRTDPGWRRLVSVRRLDHLDAADSRALLDRLGVAAPARERLVQLGRGHPLAMALLADAAEAGNVPERLADVPDLISTLLGCLVRDAPSEAHATGLATCAKAWLTTEDLLLETVGAEAPAVWAWLRRRPFIAYGARGVFPHDLVRDVLDAEFERRSPERYRRLHRIIHDHVVDGVRAASGPDRQVLAQHLLFLHRRSPLTSAFFTLRTRGSAALVPGRVDEHPAVLSMVERFRGPATAEAARGWLAEQPGQLSVVRTEHGLAGFAFHALCAESAMAHRDPLTRAALAHVAAHGPTRPGEQIDVGLFLAGAREHERDLYAVLAGSVSSIIEWVSRPLAWSFIITTDPAFWGPFFDYLTFPPVFEMDAYGVHHVAYAHDWRRLPVDPWLDLMNEREHSGGSGPPPAELLRPPPIGRADFAVAVRQALADLRRPDGLAGSRLLGTALADDPARLRAVLRAAVAELATRPRGAPTAAVLNRTYVHAAPTQEAAAEVLGLPFSTYRRHLAKAVEQLSELLWAVEIGAVRLRVEPTHPV